MVGLGIGVGIICQHFEGVISSCEGGMVTLLPLADVTRALVIPEIGMKLQLGWREVEVM